VMTVGSVLQLRTNSSSSSRVYRFSFLSLLMIVIFISLLVF
jgi:hypothetical protein